MSARKAAKTSTRKATASKAKPRTAVKDAPKVTEPKVGDQALLDAAVQAAGAWRDALTKRDEAIKAAVKGGTSARQVAQATGLSHPAVLKITRR
jgi:DNA-binding NarL/FixJ family response regulator